MNILAQEVLVGVQLLAPHNLEQSNRSQLRYSQVSWLPNLHKWNSSHKFWCFYFQDRSSRVFLRSFVVPSCEVFLSNTHPAAPRMLLQHPTEFGIWQTPSRTAEPPQDVSVQNGLPLRKDRSWRFHRWKKNIIAPLFFWSNPKRMSCLMYSLTTCFSEVGRGPHSFPTKGGANWRSWELKQAQHAFCWAI